MKYKLLIILSVLAAYLLPNNSITYNFGDILVLAPASDSLLINQTIERFIADVDDFQRKIGQYPDLKVNIVVVDDVEEYLTFARSKSSIIEFSRAFYSHKEGTIYIRDLKDHRNFVILNQILLHEYIHHFVVHFWKNPPLWFNEGMAVYFSGDLNVDREINFIKNYIMGNSIKLEQMRFRYPKNRIEWESFYAKSGLAVKYLFQKRNHEFINLWERSKKNPDFNKTFLHTFFMTPRDFSFLFEEYSKKYFTVEILLASTGMIWGILPLILIIGWIRKRIIADKIKKYWDEEDEILSEDPEKEKMHDLELE